MPQSWLCEKSTLSPLLPRVPCSSYFYAERAAYDCMGLFFVWVFLAMKDQVVYWFLRFFDWIFMWLLRLSAVLSFRDVQRPQNRTLMSPASLTVDQYSLYWALSVSPSLPSPNEGASNSWCCKSGLSCVQQTTAVQKFSSASSYWVKCISRGSAWGSENFYHLITN